tara:strand:- start:6194 stop:6523 length:330 start_codon:yes stop_codon:yes gene_type:complete
MWVCGAGALSLGLAASLTGVADAAFWFVAIFMFLSGGVLFWLGEETHPRLNPNVEKNRMKHLILLNDPPYGTERSFNGLRTAHALAKNNPEAEINVFLMANAVLCAKAR